MDGMVFIILIVAMTMVTAIITEWLKRGRHSGGDKGLSEGMFEELMSDLGLEDKSEIKDFKKKIKSLEERVQVLEKIATDKKHSLAEEIDRL